MLGDQGRQSLGDVLDRVALDFANRKRGARDCRYVRVDRGTQRPLGREVVLDEPWGNAGCRGDIANGVAAHWRANPSSAATQMRS